MYHVSGSDASAIGWVEVSGEDGANGYLWYLKAEGETRMRFTDNLEMTCLEGVRGANANTIDSVAANVGLGVTDGSAIGTQGLFDAISTRGNSTSGVTGSDIVFTFLITNQSITDREFTLYTYICFGKS